MKLHVSLLILACFTAAIISCAGTSDSGRVPGQSHMREKLLHPVDYLVPEKRYTTRGLLYQQKYRSLLLDLVKDINTIDTHHLMEGTVGFYYDKKTSEKNRLYFGYDLSMYNRSGYTGDSYTERARYVISKNLKPLLDRSKQVSPVLAEDQVMGLVIGFYWKHNDSTESTTAWIEETDLIQYHNRDITFNECMVRSIYTDQQGKIIRLLR